MKLAAARKIAEFAEPGEIVPPLLDLAVHEAVAHVVEEAARASGAAPERAASETEEAPD
jgi:malic enzyme